MHTLAKALIAALSFFAWVGDSTAATFVYTATMSGPDEAPPNSSPGTGFATLTYDDVARTMRLQGDFTGLTGVTTMAHIHAPTPLPRIGTAGVATTTPSLAGFPLGVTSGVFDTTLDMTLASSYNPTFVTANGGTTATAEVALFSAVAQGRAYFNIHSRTFPGGEIRGFFLAPVPEPATWAMLVLGFGLVGGTLRYRVARPVDA